MHVCRKFQPDGSSHTDLPERPAYKLQRCRKPPGHPRSSRLRVCVLGNATNAWPGLCFRSSDHQHPARPPQRRPAFPFPEGHLQDMGRGARGTDFGLCCPLASPRIPRELSQRSVPGSESGDSGPGRPSSPPPAGSVAAASAGRATLGPGPSDVCQQAARAHLWLPCAAVPPTPAPQSGWRQEGFLR